MIRPELTVAAVIERPAHETGAENTFLVIQEEVRGQIVTNQPAGHVEPDENLIEAVKREVLEETAWRFEPEAVVGAYLWKSPRTEDYILRVTFCGSAISHHPERELDDGIISASWVTASALRKTEQLRSPFVLQCLEDYLAGKRAPLETVHCLNN